MKNVSIELIICDIMVLVYAIISWTLLERNIKKLIGAKQISILVDSQIENVMQHTLKQEIS